jgi:hypothetical protein
MKATVDAGAFTTALADAIEFAGKDGTLPMINSVHIELREDGWLICSSTDRYAACQSRLRSSPPAASARAPRSGPSTPAIWGGSRSVSAAESRT